jgi:DNA-binding response OmpR family regulator
MHILVIEDEQRLAEHIAKVLTEERHQIDRAPDGTRGLEMALSDVYDLIVLDLMLPGIDGIALCRVLRAQGLATPVLMLTARGTVGDRVAGLDAGADDYLVKPFAFSELVARVRALGRRPPLADGTAAYGRQPTSLAFADLSLDLLTREVTRAGERIDLTAKEYALLEYLLRHAGHVLTRTQILEHVWGYDFDPGTNVVDIYIYYLRRKIDKPFTIPLIQSVRGVGYALRAAARAGTALVAD